ncbi:MAG TPA: DUF6249 domain-containing protein [Myxococcota bacterium]|nr:DUF6249 domain-containing protein [Myxococcota bacterium]
MQTSEAIVAIIALVVSFGLPLVLVAAILHYKHRKLRMTHETIARLAEKGLPVPPELLEPPRRGQHGLRGGLVLVALGLALAVFFHQVEAPWSIGLIPGLMGAALLLAWAIERRGER